MKDNDKPKTALTPQEKIRAAYARITFGSTDAEIAVILGVSNLGRVNEGIKQVLSAVGLAEPGYKDRTEPPNLLPDE